MNSKLLSAAILLTLFGCSSPKDENDDDNISASEQNVAADTTPVTVSDTTKFKFDFAIANIPSPANSLEELKKWDTEYDPAILNKTGNVSNYNSEYRKAINLGIYNMDMAYAMIHDKGPDVLQYMKSVMNISNQLGLNSAINTMVGKRAEMNINSKDSLFKILEEIFVKSDTYLRNNERVYTAANIFAGSWLESLYLTCKTGEEVNDPQAKAKARKYLWDQRFHLGNLISLLNDYKDKKECAELVAQLKPIHEEITAIKQPEALDEEKFKAISSKIYSVRSRIV